MSRRTLRRQVGHRSSGGIGDALRLLEIAALLAPVLVDRHARGLITGPRPVKPGEAARAARATAAGSSPRTRTRLSRPLAPEIELDGRSCHTPSAAAMTARTSRLAAPSTGRAPTRTASASAVQSREARRAWHPAGRERAARCRRASGITQALSQRTTRGSPAAMLQRQLVEALHHEDLHELDAEHAPRAARSRCRRHRRTAAPGAPGRAPGSVTARRKRTIGLFGSGFTHESTAAARRSRSRA